MCCKLICISEQGPTLRRSVQSISLRLFPTTSPPSLDPTFSCIRRCSRITRGSLLSITELLGRVVAFPFCHLLFRAGTMSHSNIMRRCCSPHCLLNSETCVTYQDGISRLPGSWGDSLKLVLQGANALSGQGRPKPADGTVSLDPK